MRKIILSLIMAVSLYSMDFSVQTNEKCKYLLESAKKYEKKSRTKNNTDRENFNFYRLSENYLMQHHQCMNGATQNRVYGSPNQF